MLKQEKNTRSVDFLRGGGEMGALMRGFDWASTPLGPPASWPQSLRTAIRIMLTSRQPIWIGWGPDLIYFYNDAYKSIIGGKHPWALGRPTSEVWAEIWSDIGPMLATAMSGEEGTFAEEQLLIMERSGYPEETYYTFSYSPIPDDDGGAGGIICANSEDTGRVIGERQLGLLRELAAETATARSRDAVCDAVARALGTDPHDITFALLYMAGDEPDVLDLVATCHIGSSHPAAPARLMPDAAIWPYQDVIVDGHPVRVPDLSRRFGQPLPSGPWKVATDTAAILAVPAAGETGRHGILVVGLNPYRLFDENYRGFLNLATGQISAAFANAEAYEQEKRRAEKLAELDRAKTTFFSNVSHEFRTPLTLMLGPLEEVLSKPDDSVLPDNRRLVDVAHRNGLRLMKLVNALLDFSRIEAGRVQAVYRPTDLAALTADLASTFRSATDRAGLALVVDAPELSQPVYVDRDMWEKIVLNLLSNAFKFTLDGAIVVRLAERRGVVELTVSDTGIGIAEADLPRLFERFQRVEGANARSFEGSGIGLALVQELARLHGGEVTVTSALGAGSSFTVTIPLGRAHLPPERISDEDAVRARHGSDSFAEEALRWLMNDAEDAAAIIGVHDLSENVARLTVEGAPARIVLADDNADMRDYVQRLLRGRYEVEAVADGSEALDAIHRSRPDLILTDVMMPRVDGFELLRQIRADERLRDLPVVMLSARAGEEAQIEGIEAGADDYLVKPFSARELVARVSANLETARSRRTTREALERLNEQLRAETERLSELFAEAPPLMAVLQGPDHVIELANPAYMELIGKREVLGRPFAEALPEMVDQGFVELLDRVRRSGEPFVGKGVKVRLARGQGGAIEERAVDFVYQPITDAAGQVTAIFVAGTDVTERVQAEQALLELNESLERRVAQAVAEREAMEEALRQAQKMEAVGQLTGGIAHDFNNLLTIIAGNMDMALRAIGSEESAPKLRRAIGNAQKGAERAAALTQRLLAFSRRQPLQPKALDADKLITGMSEMLKRALGETVHLETVTAPGLWRVEADPNQLESALLNLAVNARDAMPAGGKLTIETANARLDEAYASNNAEVGPGDYVVIAVSDTGVGMSKQTLARVFEPFYTTKEVGKGTGLGLSMVYGFVKQSGGHVKIYSEEGHGTTVKVYLPRLIAGGIEQEAISEGPVAAGSRNETILVAEDDDGVRAYTVEILRELGYRVLEAHDGPAALSLVERQDVHIDLLFTDVVMPSMSGRELSDAARAMRPTLKVLYTSGYTRNAIVHGGRLDPGVQIIAKPFTFDALSAKVRDVLDNGTFGRVLLVNQDAGLGILTAEALVASGYAVDKAGTSSEALGMVRAARGNYTAAVIDGDLPDGSGYTLVKALRGLRADLPILLIAGEAGRIEVAASDPCTRWVTRPYPVEVLQQALASLGVAGAASSASGG